jgi:four helix bundle protein
MFQTLTIGAPALKNIFSRAIEFRLPKATDAHVRGKQALRSGTSVGANYREAHRACSKPKFIAKCGDCLREIEETAYWLASLFARDVTITRIHFFHHADPPSTCEFPIAPIELPRLGKLQLQPSGDASVFR